MKKPVQVQNEVSKALEAFRERQGKLIELSEKDKERICKVMKREYDKWVDGNKELHARLERWNDLMENIIRDVDLPFEGASQVHIPMVAIYAKVYHSVERRSILGSGETWYLQTLDQNLEEYIPDIEECINYKARAEWNTCEVLSDGFHNANRDGLAPIQFTYRFDTETVEEVFIITSPEDLAREFPDPEESGMSPEEWMGYQMAAETASEEEPLEIPAEYERETYRGPYGEVVELADFVLFPHTAKSIDRRDCKAYGKRFSASKEDLKQGVEDGLYYKDAVSDVIKGQGSKPTSYQMSKDFAAGINRPGKSEDYELIEMIYSGKLYDKEKRYIVIYSREKEVLVGMRPYDLNVESYALLRIEKKTNQLVGGSVCGGLSDLNAEVDGIHNERRNSMRITMIPSFKGKKGGEEFDPNAYENQWRPGVIFWLEDPEKFTQNQVQPTDLGASLNEENLDMRYASITMGIDPFVNSGNALPDDKQAPGNKTAMLIQQANLRMDDPISELRYGVEDVGKIVLALEYKFGPPILTFKTGQDQVTKTISRKYLRSGLKVFMAGTTVAMNPEAEFAKWFSVYQALMAEPLIQGSAKRRIEALKLSLTNGRIPNRNKILPSLDEIEKEEIGIRVKAFQQMMSDQQKQAADAEVQKKQVVQSAIKEREQRLMKLNQMKAQMDKAKNGNGSVPAAV